VSGGKVKRSILSNRVRVEENASVDGSILMGGVEIGAGARLQRTIVDKWTKIPAGAEIGFDLEADRRRFTVTDSGVVVVPRGYEFQDAPRGVRVPVAGPR